MKMKKKIYNKNLGKIIKKERKTWGMSKNKLGFLIGEEFDYIDDLEKGFENEPPFDVLLKIAIVLQINVFDLLNKDITEKELLKFIN